jgi:hypothetical protein
MMVVKKANHPVNKRILIVGESLARFGHRRGHSRFMLVSFVVNKLNKDAYF